MEINDFYLKEIQITIFLNTTSNWIDTKSTILTSDILINEKIKRKKLNKYPFISTKYLMPIEHLQSRSYNKIIHFYFNKKRMESVMKKKYNNTTINETEITKKNVQNMLLLLFPTFFIPNNIFSSFNGNILNNSFVSKKNQYCHLNIEGDKYTVFKLIWLNSINDHPIYKKFQIQTINYKKWSTEKNTQIKSDIMDMEENLFKFLSRDFEQTDYYSKLKLEIKRYDYKNPYYSSEQEDDNNSINNLIDKLYKDWQNYKNEIDKLKKNENHDNKLKIKSYYRKIYRDIYNIYEIYDKLVKKYKAFSSNSRIGIDIESINSYLYKFIQKYYKITRKIKILVIIKDKYIKENNQEFNTEYEDEDVVEILKNNFKKFNDIIENIQNITSPNRQLIGKCNDFQSNLEKILNNNTDNKDLFENLFKNEKCEIYIDEINLRKMEEPQYEIFVLLNVVKGLVNEENKNQIICRLKNKLLEDNLKKLLFTKETGEIFLPTYLSLNEKDEKIVPVPNEKEKEKEK